MSESPPLDATPLVDDLLPQQKWIGRWPGTIVDTADPEKRGRVKVRVPQVYGDESEAEFITDADLPWAHPSFPVHDIHVGFKPGDGVWVEFWGGDSNFPIWCGQFLGDGDAPTEFASSYTPTPKTRIMRTTNGHIIEMRWVKDQEKIRIRTEKGLYIDLIDNLPEQGLRIEAGTPQGRKLTISDFPAFSRAALETPTQRIEANDTPIPTVNIISTGVVTVQGQGLALNSTGGAPTTMVGGGTLTSTFVGNAAYNFLGTLAWAVVGAVTLVGSGLVSITAGAGLELLVTAGLVSLGLAGLKRKLVDERFLLHFDTHVHSGVVTGPGVSGVPTVPATPLVGVLATANTEAN